jgi:esterase/lipase superfamily enzyme
VIWKSGDHVLQINGSSFFMKLFRLGIVGLMVLPAACAGRPGPETLAVTAPSVPAQKTVTLFAATNRARLPGRSNAFSDKASEDVSFARYQISIPADHKAGNIEWPTGGRPDPQTDFTVVEQERLSAVAFDASVGAAASSKGPESRRVGVFVHGFNYNFQEALFRAAQMSADTNLDGSPVVFSWPSKARIAGYLADKEAVTYSRDALVDTLIGTARAPGIDQIILFGHSMGAWLVMEAARQLKLEGRNDVLAKIQIVLAAPDIDAEVFRSQLNVIGRMKTPITLLVSPDDLALKLSSFVTADSRRIGALDVKDPTVQEAARKYNVEVVDISTLKGSDSVNHDRYVGIAKILPSLAAEGNAARNAGAFVLNATTATLTAPLRIVSQAVSP